MIFESAFSTTPARCQSTSSCVRCSPRLCPPVPLVAVASASSPPSALRFRNAPCLRAAALGASAVECAGVHPPPLPAPPLPCLRRTVQIEGGTTRTDATPQRRSGERTARRRASRPTTWGRIRRATVAHRPLTVPIQCSHCEATGGVARKGSVPGESRQLRAVAQESAARRAISHCSAIPAHSLSFLAAVCRPFALLTLPPSRCLSASCPRVF